MGLFFFLSLSVSLLLSFYIYILFLTSLRFTVIFCQLKPVVLQVFSQVMNNMDPPHAGELVILRRSEVVDLPFKLVMWPAVTESGATEAVRPHLVFFVFLCKHFSSHSPQTCTDCPLVHPWMYF